ncbi:hypothetical protein EHEL_061530 [Encephalitozoon hellem ATCC 50504]|uniref:Uncharacterized protein n=1 Tax=Encephalitozoon hellem TaxID=27973 RepID=A0A9Q9F8C0_ENCHE|nr:uncharacterized protein EHEL_061530 [Encephalitozoon hellem ATCC 50504]AFM98522.1 hypothetical protein EHEL_061530 [Encephalitozoon hellem ATCC 50504]UTX43449.1 hypothetical protein GPU96_06g12010 [Encephalitozoon hellem]|eukprot:XP_003887503.1 hypothetical protein EHEL_061530 [Encephalitozoon hellem ATCC 50504]
MLLKLLFLAVIACDRLLRLKHRDSQYVTNSKGVLKLESPMLPTLSDQRVVVHNRVLYFFKDGIYYTLAMVHGELEIKPIVYNAMSEKGIGFSSSPTFRPRKRKIDPFGYLSHAGRRDSQGDSEKGKDSLPSNKRKPGLVKLPSRNERITAQKRTERMPRNSPKDREEGSWNDKTHQVKKDKSFEANLDVKNAKAPKEGPDETETLDSSDKLPAYGIPPPRLEVETGNALQNIRPPKKVGSIRRSHVVESDSKMDEREFGYVIKNVTVSEVDDKGHFTLIGGSDFCVTYYKDSFVFMPCSRAPEQIFKLESSEEIVKKGKSFGLKEDKDAESQDAIVLDSTDSEEERKEELYKSPQTLSYSLKSVAPGGGNFGARSAKAGFRDAERYPDRSLDKENSHNLKDLSKDSLHFENSHRPSKIDTNPEKSAIGVTPIAMQPTQIKSGARGLNSNTKEPSKHQKLNFDDDFIDKFRELLTNSDLNDFV